MPSFVESLKKGAQNAEVAAKNRALIDALIKQLSDDVRAWSNGAISEVQVEEMTNFIPDLNPFAAIDPFKPRPGRTVKYNALVARRKGVKDDDTVAELCEITISPSGFPVTLVYAKRDVRCNDPTALEKALQALLEYPETGELLKLLTSEGAAG